MDLSIIDFVGLPEGSILSVRSGPTRRQSPLPCAAPFRLPAGPWPLRIDILGLLGKTAPGVFLCPDPETGLCKLAIEGRDGRKMSVTLQVSDPESGFPRPATIPHFIRRVGVDGHEGALQPVKRRDAEADARAYLDKHRLHEFMHALFELLLRERPDDPYKFIASRFQEAAGLELETATLRLTEVLDPSASTAPKVSMASRSCVSTAPTSTALSGTLSGTIPSPSRDSRASTAGAFFAEGLQLGGFKATVRSMRGRSMARITVSPGEKVGEIKARLESMIGTSAAGMQLLWWAEMLPNDTTLEDHGIEPGPVVLNIICSNRTPKMNHVLTGSSEGGMRLWSLTDAEIVRDFSSSSSAVLAMAVNWESMRALSGTFDGRLQLWDLSTGLCLQTIASAHKEEVSCLEVDWVGRQAVTGSSDGTAKFWCLKECKCLHVIWVGTTVWNIAVDWNSRRLFCGLRTGVVRHWSLEGIEASSLGDFKTGAKAAEDAGTSVSGMAIDCLGLKAVTGFEDGHLAYWHFGEPELTNRQAASGSPQTGPQAEAVAASLPVSVPAGAAGGSPAKIESGGSPEAVEESPPRVATKVLLAHYSALRTIVAQWKDKGSRALVGSDDGSLSLWRLDSSECLARFARHVGFVWAIEVDWAKERAVSGAFDGCLKLWDLRNGECLRTISAHSRPIRSISVG
mmetsp:Transcript_51724/g.83932  ORF Transcript_51724/g.83932 Transcript_51724/m.83932 type:complete len:683 (+) Transcript_51724:75-2123(+)|eukprot:CAMPEP_0115088238 /NCGR_PEP_ID=MMETSP0227-20121206/23857_1 /TAXON_ID=89957 /ORGANISM="Polarella glacialis, Strain CCMP 1383" /LENGTH=682 /DNA_ID=CAMNT_0002478439 /DNA_START=66 /DNA_END=2114 /DNA_ORIENTATION=-